MQPVIGGDLFTVDDDVHADASAVPDCASHIVGYFDTGTGNTMTSGGNRIGLWQPA